MDSDISPIFDQATSSAGAPMNSDATPIEDVIQEEYIGPQQSMQQYPSQYMYQQQSQPPPSSQTPHWDPFSTIGITSWVVIGIIFILGFIVGKLR